MRKISLVVCFVVVFVAALSTFFLHGENKAELSTVNNVNPDELLQRHIYLATHIVKKDVHPFLRPVCFTIHKKEGEELACYGTLMLNGDLTPSCILTANHLFSETRPGSDYYDYHVMGPNGDRESGHLSRVVLDSVRTSDNPKGINDIAICYMGEPGLISRVSKVCVSSDIGFSDNYRVGKLTHEIMVTSIMTGERYRVVGQIVNSQKLAQVIMLYQNLPGESGSGFWGDDKRFYVISGSMPVNQYLREHLNIPDDFKTVTVLSGADIHW